MIQLVHPLVVAQIPTYAVLGNHDYGAKAVTEASASDIQRAAQIQQALEAV